MKSVVCILVENEEILGMSRQVRQPSRRGCLHPNRSPCRGLGLYPRHTGSALHHVFTLSLEGAGIIGNCLSWVRSSAQTWSAFTPGSPCTLWKIQSPALQHAR